MILNKLKENIFKYVLRFILPLMDFCGNTNLFFQRRTHFSSVNYVTENFSQKFGVSKSKFKWKMSDLKSKDNS